MGSGGTLSGVSRYLKEKNPGLRVVLVDPHGSGLYCHQVARRHPGEGLRIVTLLCDHGSRYSSRVFNPEFLASKQLEVTPLPT